MRYLRWKEFRSGEAGIRTLGRVTPSPVFKTGAIGRSATSPVSTADGVSYAVDVADSKVFDSFCRMGVRGMFSLKTHGNSVLLVMRIGLSSRSAFPEVM